MNVSLPDELKAFVDRRTSTGAYSSSSEYVRELIRRDRELEDFRDALLQGAESPVHGPADDGFFDALRSGDRRR